MAIQWKYTDSTNTIVIGTDDFGAMVSTSASNPDIIAWVNAGNTITPAAGETTAAQIAALVLQLEALDPFLPRGLEDFWTQTGYDTTLLPAQTQTRLSTKQSLRSQIAALNS